MPKSAFPPSPPAPPAPPLLDRSAGEEGTPVSLEFGRPRSDTGKMAKFKLTLFRGHVSERASGGNKSYTGGGGWPQAGQGQLPLASASASASGFVHSSVPFGANGVQVTHLPAGGGTASPLMHTHTHSIFALPFFSPFLFLPLFLSLHVWFVSPPPLPTPSPLLPSLHYDGNNRRPRVCVTQRQ